MNCPKCNSTNLGTYRHANAKIWCEDCGFVLREEGEKDLKVPPERNFIAYAGTRKTLWGTPSETMDSIALFKCLECNTEGIPSESNYCPNCGVKFS